MGISESNTLVASFGWVAIGILIVLAGITAVVLRRRGRTPGGTRPRATGSTFEDLAESRALRDAIAGLGWTRPTAVQADTIAQVRKGRDVVAVAPAGNDRTAAYLIPALDRQVDQEGLHTLVLVPTRGSVEQVAAQARALASHADLWVGELHAGEPMSAQIRDLRAGFDMLVATPGRLLEHIEAGNVRLDEVELLVLDDVDRLIEAADRARVEKILEATPGGRQTLGFVAAPSREVREFARQFLRDPVNVEATAPAGPPANNSRDGADGRITGTVKWFSDSKGFGFITIGDSEKDCFVHYSAILGDGYRSLSEGDLVAFEMVSSPKGPEAANVSKV